MRYNSVEGVQIAAARTCRCFNGCGIMLGVVGGATAPLLGPTMAAACWQPCVRRSSGCLQSPSSTWITGKCTSGSAARKHRQTIWCCHYHHKAAELQYQIAPKGAG